MESFNDLQTLNSRTATLRLTSRGVDMSADIAASVTSFTFTEHGHGKADDIRVKFEDVEGLWKKGWAPDKGDKLTAAIVCRNWLTHGDALTLSCGTFTADELEVAGPPDTATVKAVASYISSPLRQELKTGSWENTTLETVARDIAGRNGLSLFYQGEAVTFERLEQRQESDLAFLQRVSEKQGLNLKVNDGRITLFDGAKADAQTPALTIARGQSSLSRFSFRTKSMDVFGGCQVDYWDCKKKRKLGYSYNPASAPNVGHKLKVNKRCESEAEARRIARHELRKANKNEIEGTLDCMGLPTIYAGQVIAVSGFGAFNANFYVETTTHRVDRGAGYTTSLRIRRTLDY